MLAATILVVLAQTSGGWFEERFAAGGGTAFMIGMATCTDTRPPKAESTPAGMIYHCVASTWSENKSNHSHGVKMRAIDPTGKQFCEVATVVAPHLPSAAVAEVQARYPLQPSATSKVPPGTYKIQLCRKEIVPPGQKPEDPLPEYCMPTMATLQVRPGADSLRCALPNH